MPTSSPACRCRLSPISTSCATASDATRRTGSRIGWRCNPGPTRSGWRVGAPVGTGVGHLAGRQRLRDAVGAAGAVRGRGVPAALLHLAVGAVSAAWARCWSLRAGRSGPLSAANAAVLTRPRARASAIAPAARRGLASLRGKRGRGNGEDSSVEATGPLPLVRGATASSPSGGGPHGWSSPPGVRADPCLGATWSHGVRTTLADHKNARQRC